jgi:hypothetical protein
MIIPLKAPRPWRRWLVNVAGALLFALLLLGSLTLGWMLP